MRTTKTRVVPKIGDIVEIETPKGLAYVQYTAKHTDAPVFGELVRVLPDLYKTRPSDISALAQRKENYFIFTPISLACRRKQATIVSNEPVPDWAQGIPLMRMANKFDEDGKGHDWCLWDGMRTLPANGPTAELSKLSIASIWGHDVLVEKLAERWLPTDEPVENASLRKSARRASADHENDIESDSTTPREVRHYLYFPSEASAKDAGEKLKADGYSVKVQLSRAEDSWLVETTARIQLEEKAMNDAMSDLKRFADSNGGEYDGWDVLVDDTG